MMDAQLMDASSDDECVPVLDQSEEVQPSKKFTASQTAVLNAFFSSGMKGVGKGHAAARQRAAKETGLSEDQVKVNDYRAAKHCVF